MCRDMHVNSTWMFADTGHVNHDTPIAKAPESPVRLKLDKNYPNPFNPNATMRYTLPKPDHVELAIYNMHGHKIETLIDTR